MKKEYDFSNAVKNPYYERLKNQVPIEIAAEIADYFKAQSDEVGIPYQTLINMYLKDCIANNRKLEIKWG